MATMQQIQEELTQCVRAQARCWNATRDLETLIRPEEDIDGLDGYIQSIATDIVVPDDFKASPQDVQNLLDWAEIDLATDPVRPDVQKVMQENERGVWGEFPKYPRTDWQYEVAHGDTNLGYWEWVSHKLTGEDESGRCRCHDESNIMVRDGDSLSCPFCNRTISG